MDLLVQSPALRCAAAALATAISVSALAQATRRWGSGRWATTSALVLGCEDARRGDLRFAAFVATIAAGLAWVVALEAQLKGLAPTARALGVVVGFPAVALLVAVLADVLRGSDEDEDDEEASETAPAVEETLAPAPRPSRTPAEVRALLDRAVADLGAARSRTVDAGTRDALISMEEALESYRSAVDEPGADLDRIAGAIGEVVRLARTCDEDLEAPAAEGPAFALLGLRRDASFVDTKRVYRELARIYHADAALPGVDPAKFVELSEAFERVRAYFCRSESSARTNAPGAPTLEATGSANRSAPEAA